MKRFCVLLVGCLLGCGAAASAPVGVYAFGDSALEQGNFYTLPDGVGAAAAPPSPPYFSKGGFIRDSNGPVWVEIAYPGMRPVRAGAPYGRRVNFGFDGARTGTGSINAGGVGTGVLAQVRMFEKLRASGDISPQADDIYVIDAGPNDVFQAIFFAPSDPSVAARKAARNLTDAAMMLVKDGARYVFVNDFADTGLAPIFLSVAPEVGKTATFASAVGSAALHAAVRALNGTLGREAIVILPSRSVVARVVAHPVSFGFSNAKDPCFDAAKGTACAADRTGQDRYLFWDVAGHPTVAGQRLLAALYLGTINYVVGGKAAQR